MLSSASSEEFARFSRQARRFIFLLRQPCVYFSRRRRFDSVMPRLFDIFADAYALHAQRLADAMPMRLLSRRRICRRDADMRRAPPSSEFFCARRASFTPSPFSCLIAMLCRRLPLFFRRAVAFYFICLWLLYAICFATFIFYLSFAAALVSPRLIELPRHAACFHLLMPLLPICL